MERIVVGIDNESASDVAVGWVIRRAQEKALRMRLVTAFDMLVDDPTVAEERLERLRARIEASAPGAAVTTALIDGSIPEALVAESREADLLVLGYHRRRPVRSLFAGALSSRLAARAHSTTVIVPEDWEPREGRILLGVGDDDAAQTAIEFALAEATHPRRDLEVVHAWQLPTPSWDALGAFLSSVDDLHDAHRDLLATAAQQMRDAHPALTIREVLAEGPAARALLDHSAEAELVVVGTHRRGLMSGLLLGSTVLDLLPECRVPVAVVPLSAPLAPVGGTLAAV